MACEHLHRYSIRHARNRNTASNHQYSVLRAVYGAPSGAPENDDMTSGEHFRLSRDDTGEFTMLKH